jgi:hypothetical protein
LDAEPGLRANRKVTESVAPELRLFKASSVADYSYAHGWSG